MRERPILFSAPMVRGILEDRKTQTRRVVKPQPPVTHDRTCCCPVCREERPEWRWYHAPPIPDDDTASPHMVLCPYGVPGDLLWVRETLRYDWVTECWRFDATSDRLGVLFGRELERPRPDRWPTGVCPSIHMPRWASRISLRITDVRVERLQDCSEADAKAEGVAEYPCEGPHRGPGATYWSADGVEPFGPIKRTTPIAAFKALWEEINGEGSWAANPWVWVVEFERVQP